MAVKKRMNILPQAKAPVKSNDRWRLWQMHALLQMHDVWGHDFLRAHAPRISEQNWRDWKARRVTIADAVARGWGNRFRVRLAKHAALEKELMKSIEPKLRDPQATIRRKDILSEALRVCIVRRKDIRAKRQP